MVANYDASGWATKNDLLCSDGRTIRRDAFKDCDNQVVPLVWSHMHNDPENVLGHALLKNTEDGVRTYLRFNKTPRGKLAKELVEHGDIKNLSIYANKLKQKAGDVLHGVIREVSLVLAGANPGAVIDFPTVAHSDNEETEAYIYTYTDEGLYLAHSDDSIDWPGLDDLFNEEIEESKPEEKLEHKEKEEESTMADNKETKEKKENQETEDKTVQEVFDSMSPEQQNVCYFMIGQALEDAGVDISDDEEGEDKDMSHNVFDTVTNTHEDVLSHSDMVDILNTARRSDVGSLQTALNMFAEDRGVELALQHDDDPAPVSGFGSYPNGATPANVTLLFPEYANPNGNMPELITNDQGWVDVVLRKVSKSPFSRVRTSHVDIRNIEELRARGYQKGQKKDLAGNYEAVRRETDPQTVYVTSELNRDDVIDITDFDYVQYQYNIDRMQLNEELAMAIMLGDFRSNSSKYKIKPDHIRPIWTDDELYTLHADIDIAAMRESLQGSETGSYFGDNYVYAEALIEQLLYTRENMKGSGNPDFFMTPHMLNVMLLARDRNGRRIFSSKAELASALNVANIYTAEQFANRIRTDSSNNQHKLLGICVNLSDYNVGATKGGQITHFTDFDIKFNQLESLLETRCSGALKRVYSAVVIEEPVA